MKNSVASFISKAAILACTMLSVSTTVSADTLDFSSFSNGYQNTTTLTLSNAVIKSYGQDLYIGAAGIDNEICSIGSQGCQADMAITFNSAVNGLTFVTSGWQQGDQVNVNAYNGETLLGSILHASNGLVDLSAFSNITRVYLDDQSSAFGVAYDHFSFSVTAVPEPESYAMFLAGLGIVGAAIRRRKMNVA